MEAQVTVDTVHGGALSPGSYLFPTWVLDLLSESNTLYHIYLGD